MSNWKAGFSPERVRAVLEHNNEIHLTKTFTWAWTPEGFHFWSGQYEKGLTEEGRARLKAMLAEYEGRAAGDCSACNGKGKIIRAMHGDVIPCATCGSTGDDPDFAEVEPPPEEPLTPPEPTYVGMDFGKEPSFSVIADMNPPTEFPSWVKEAYIKAERDRDYRSWRDWHLQDWTPEIDRARTLMDFQKTLDALPPGERARWERKAKEILPTIDRQTELALRREPGLREWAHEHLSKALTEELAPKTTLPRIERGRRADATVAATVHETAHNLGPNLENGADHRIGWKPE